MRLFRIALLLLLAAAPAIGQSPISLTGSAWLVENSTDTAGNHWSGSSLVFTSQKPTSAGYELQGYFDWRGSGGQFGRELFSGTLSLDRRLTLSGNRIDPSRPSNGIVLARYGAVLSADASRLLNGSWPTGIPGSWEASRHGAAVGGKLLGADPSDAVRGGSDPPICTTSSSNAALSSPVTMTGNPVRFATGNKLEQVTDYETAGPNSLAFTRFYNAQAVSGPETFPTALGVNWRGTFDRYIRIVSDSAVVAERADGRTLDFGLQNGTWAPYTDVDLRLVRRDETTWTLTDAADTLETYTLMTAGKAILTEIEYRNGHRQMLQYDSQNRLIAVADTFGRQLTFTHVGARLETLTTPDGLVVTYTYQASGVGVADRLAGVAYSTTPASSVAYLYEDFFYPFALTGLVDENGVRYATWRYDIQGRVILSQHAGGADLTQIAYNDADGSRTVTNPLGLRTSYRFTVLQGVPKLTRAERLATPTTPAAVQNFTYDENGFLASGTDCNGTLTTYVNDAHGLPTAVTEAAGTPQARTTTLTYHDRFRLPVRIVQPGITTETVYDGSGNPLTRTQTDTTERTVPYSTNGAIRTWTLTWSNGLLASVRGPRTDIPALTQLAYTQDGALARVTNALGHVTQVIRHTPGGRPLILVDPNGVTTELTYDARQRLTSATLNTASGPLTARYAYDPAGSLRSVTSPDGSALSNTYDGARRLTGVTDLLAARLVYTLDAMGGRTTANTLDAAGAVTRTQSAAFDALGRPVRETGGEGQTTLYAYDHVGNLLTITDPLGRITRQAFDPLNRLISVADAAGGVTRTTYDDLDRPLTVTDPKGSVTTYSYDGFGRNIQTVSPDTGTTVYRYDLADNLVEKRDARGVITRYDYDALDRLRVVTYPASPSENIQYRFDEEGHGFGIDRLTSMTDAVGTLERRYDERGNVTLERRTRGAVTLSTGYAYDAANRVASIAYPSGGRADYARDRTGRVASLSFTPAGGNNALPVAADISYRPFGPVASLIFGNGIVETRGFDRDYRLTVMTAAAAGAATFQRLTYTYDAADNVRALADGVEVARSQTFGYDILDRLTAATGAYGALAYTYDPVGNRLTAQTGQVRTDYIYASPGNRLTQIKTGSASQLVSYTASGNIAGFDDTQAPPTTLRYNDADRLAQVLSGAVPVGQYLYDGFGRRLARTGQASGMTLFKYDLDGHLLEDSDGQGKARVDYIYLGNRPIGTFQIETGQLSYLHSDRLGTPQLATSAARTVVWKASYEPFGSARLEAALIGQNLRLPGQEFEADTSWHHNGFRDYAPALGRYLEADPIGLMGGPNAYAYVEANPLRHTDRSGLAIGDFPGAPPEYDPKTWRHGKLPNGLDWIQNPKTGKKYTVHPEDDGHWRHWDVTDREGKSLGRCPDNTKKPWPTQKRPPYGGQSGTDPSGDAPPWKRPTLPMPLIPPAISVPPSIVPPLIINPCLLDPFIPCFDGDRA